VVLDFLCAMGVGIAAVERWTRGQDVPLAGLSYSVIGGVIFPVAWLIMLAGHGAYESRYLGLGSDEFKRVVKAAISLTALVCFVVFVFKLPMSRFVVGTSLPGGMLLTLLGRYAARKVLHGVRRSGRASHRLLLVGSARDVREVLITTRRNGFAGLVPVGVCLTGPSQQGDTMGGNLPVVTGLTEALPAVARLGADMIAVCGSRGVSSDELRRLAWQIEGTGIDLVVAPSLTNIAGPRVHIRPVEGLPLLHVEEPRFGGTEGLVKTAGDRLLAAFGLVVLAPLLAVVAIVIKTTSPGPVFFRQARTGKDGETFRVWKFRTMYVDAEQRLADLLEQNESNGLLFKVKEDPRITRVGHVLRQFSLDELPQLINVLAGEMSLVGPRPLPVRDEDFLGDVRRRLVVRPGITGLWQVSGRSNLSWEESVRLDLYYVDNWSLVFDAMILWRTLFVVLRRKGAY